MGPEWSAAIGSWAGYQQASGRTPATVAVQRGRLMQLANALDDESPWDLTPAQLATWLHRFRAPETRRAHRSTLVAFYAWGVESEICPSNPALSTARVPPVAPRPRRVRRADYAAALAAADPREALMLRLAAEVGLRRGEVARVHSSDLLDEDDGWSLLVHGKGERDRVIPLPDGLAAGLRALPAGWAFPGHDRGHLSPAHVGKLVAARLPAGLSMHSLRHTFATAAYQLAHDMFAVQALLGHASPETTRRYVATTASTMRATVRALTEGDPA